ncbi:MAG: ribonuclease E/G [Rhodospirillaceae bacterium]|nr:ribonuclease E/G [Rhodospirillaceae bacterium]
MSKRMLIDGAHSEEIRVVVTSGTRLDEYDIETTFKKQVKGNIYLAKVTRVEPSLQAAFVDFGGNRHGFLAFSEIHPDYYQIPVDDRQALIEEQETLEKEARAAREHLEDIDEASDDSLYDDAPDTVDHDDLADDGIFGADDKINEASAEDADATSEPESDDRSVAEEEDSKGAANSDNTDDAAAEDSGDDPGPVAADPDVEEALEAAEKASSRRTRSMRRYKIQEVIKRRQILLIQVVKEERGNKGAALTTYISLAGRYCVLMPNSSRGGGISRKITGAKERRKLRDTLNSLDMPKGMGVIIRTAGLERNKAEIKRDFEYLIRAWDEVRKTTLESSAPAMVYEEGDIIKRAIRDVYSKDIEEIQVEGTKTYQNAKRFMRLMMPSHAKRVQQYRDDAIPLYQRFQIEQQLDAMHKPEVQLKSGGYIVINPTEALVAIDVNSGKSTKERNIEETALKTNLEAADEVGRQLRLRDLAGLIVIDFIDMEDGRNVRKVERRLREAMKADRARLQIGRISNFGLLELSRQRLRPSLLETSSQVCPHCRGTGTILSTESMAMRVLRAIEEEGIRMRTSEITVKVPTEVALYILNQKRSTLVNLEARYGFQVVLEGDNSVIPPDIDIERIKGRPEPAAGLPARGTGGESASTVEEISAAGADAEAEDESQFKDSEEKPKRGRRRRGRRRSQSDDTRSDNGAENIDSLTADPEEEAATSGRDTTEGEHDGEEKPARRRRRGRRGGRRRNRNIDADTSNDDRDGEKITAGSETSDDTANGNADDKSTPEPIEAEIRETPSARADSWAEGETVSAQKLRSDRPNSRLGDDRGGENKLEDTNFTGSDAKTAAALETSPEGAGAEDPGLDRQAVGLADTPVADNIKPRRKGWWQKIVE